MFEVVGQPAFPTTLLEFQRRFPDEAACADHLERVRWPDGFVCAACRVVGEPYRVATRLALRQCRSCGHQTSLTAGTVMHRTKQPLLVWFWSAYLVTTQTPGMSALQLQRQLGLRRYETAFLLLHKLRAGMLRPGRDCIGSQFPVEVDETYVGGRTRGLGRGVHQMALVIAAVEVRPRTKAARQRDVLKADVVRGGKRRRVVAGRVRLQVLGDRSGNALEDFVVGNVEPKATVITDGYVGYNNLTPLGYDHRPFVVNGDAEKLDEVLPMVHIVFANLKTWLQGTHHGVSRKHLQTYLNEYVFRFNRRFYPMTSFNSVLGIAAQVPGPTSRGLYDGSWERRRHAPRRADHNG